jgi:mono/diheme cytochrome c family protein
MTTNRRTILIFIALAGLAPGCKLAGEDHASLVSRGEHLVKLGACNDCHTPVKMGPHGPESDVTRYLSGHPGALAMPPAPALPEGPWVATVGATMTAWNGPWGTSFTANLTPDAETGLGKWTAADFIATMRTGRHLGKGRAILPPMPIPVLQQYSDDELTAVFAYLTSVPAIANKVPGPIEPPAARTAAAR